MTFSPRDRGRPGPPVPASFFYTTTALVLVVSFVLLGGSGAGPWRRIRAGGAPRGLESALLSRALRVLLGAISVGLLALTLASALRNDDRAPELAPTFVYVVFWLGLPLLSVLLGDVWRVLSPWRALADVTVWAIERTGREAAPILTYSERFGRYPGAVALFAFVSLELAHPRERASHARHRDRALQLLGSRRNGGVRARRVDTGGEGFAVAFGLLARIAPFAARDGSLVVRWPLTGLAGVERVPARSSSSR